MNIELKVLLRRWKLEALKREKRSILKVPFEDRTPLQALRLVALSNWIVEAIDEIAILDSEVKNTDE